METAEAFLGYHFIGISGKFRDNFGLGSSLDTMGRKHIEFQIVRLVVVTDIKNLRPCFCFLFQESLDVGYNAPSSSTTIKRITLLQKAAERIYYQYYSSHGITNDRALAYSFSAGRKSSLLTRKLLSCCPHSSKPLKYFVAY